MNNERFEGWLSDLLIGACAFPRTGENHYDFGVVNGWRSSAESALIQIVGKNSPYYTRFVAVAIEDKNGYAPLVKSGVEIIATVLDDLRKGRVISVQRLIESEVFTDFAEQAQHILENGYYGAAAALMGGVLERGLKSIASIHTVKEGAAGDLEGLNARIARHGVYNSLRQREVQFFITVRNKAAHGEFETFTREDVSKMISGVTSLLAAYA